MARRNSDLLPRNRLLERVKAFGPVSIRFDKHADKVTQRIVEAYSQAYDTVRANLDFLAGEAASAKYSGIPLTDAQIARLARVDRALSSITDQISELNRLTGVHISGVVGGVARERIDGVIHAMSSVAGTDLSFTKPNSAEIEAMVFRSTEQIESATNRLTVFQSNRMKEALMLGLARGENPNTTAKWILRDCDNAFLGGLPRATNIARTELMDVARFSDRMVYTNSPLVRGWVWLATLDARTCPACWAMHNTFHQPTELQYGHQQCRCTSVPVLYDDDPADFDLGDPEEKFWSLPRDEQLAIMGPGRLAALEGGAPFSSLTFLGQNTGWRPSQKLTTVADLTGLAKLAIARTPGDLGIPGQSTASILDTVFASGGMTIRTLDGSQPSSGYVVALGNDLSMVVDAHDFFDPKIGPAKLAEFMRANQELLDAEGGHLGLWYDHANGKVVVDPVKILDDRDAAIALGRAKDQVAIFDLNTFSEIQTGGSGGYVAQALSAGDVGRVGQVTRDGVVSQGTVVAAGDWGATVQLPDGSTVTGGPDQFNFVSSDAVPPMPKSDLAETAAIGRDSTLRSLGVGDVSYVGLKPDLAHEYDDSLTRNVEKWGVAPVAVKADALRDGTFAMTNTGRETGTSEILFSTKYPDLATMESRMAKAESVGHFHAGVADEGAAYTASHEYGHVLANALLGDVGSEATTSLMYSVAEHFVPGYKGSLDDSEKLMDAVRSDLSGYASFAAAEQIAEGYATYVTLGSGKSWTADRVMFALLDAYQRQHGGAVPEAFESDWNDLRGRFG